MANSSTMSRQQFSPRQQPSRRPTSEFAEENLEDVSSAMAGAVAPGAPPTAGERAFSDDMMGGAGSTPTKQPPSPGGLGESQSFPEVQGDVVTQMPSIESGQGPENIAEAHREVGVDASESGEEFVEATPEQMAAAVSGAEAGEESSALSDLRGLPGFAAPEFSAEAIVLREAGTATEGGQQEFLPILAALVPTLVSTVGPLVAKAIAGRVSQRARTAITRLASAPRQPVQVRPAGSKVQSPQGTGSLANLLPVLAKLLQTAATKAGGESAGAEAIDEAFVEEAAAAMEVILGVDQRLPITNTHDIPWRRLCALRITFPSGASYRGTGFFIGPRAVATAGHCVYLRNQGGWARKIEVIPGSNGSKRPFGQAESTLFRSVGGWVSSQLPECDYGCIFLSSGSFAGKNLGHFGAAAFDAQTLVAQPAVVAGYHGDKPFAELWGMAEVIKTVSAKTLAYPHDTVGGCSGAPVYIKRNNVRYVVGIHNYGANTGNSATRITEPVYQRLLAWSRM